MWRGFIFSVIVLLAVGTVNYAETFEIKDNGSTSTNSITVQNSQSTTVVQHNSANVTNSVQNSANTGGNNASNNQGDATIKTGDAHSSTTINNTLNSNNATVKQPCCSPTPSKTPQATVTPSKAPTPTQSAGTGGGSSSGSTNNGGTSNSSGGIGGAAIETPHGNILGLAATSGKHHMLPIFAQGFGILCLVVATLILKRQNVA